MFYFNNSIALVNNSFKAELSPLPFAKLSKAAKVFAPTKSSTSTLMVFWTALTNSLFFHPNSHCSLLLVLDPQQYQYQQLQYRCEPLVLLGSYKPITFRWWVVDIWSDWHDLNVRPLVPKTSVLTKLNYNPIWWIGRDSNSQSR